MPNRETDQDWNKKLGKNVTQKEIRKYMGRT
jgi:hypothetical protein